MIFLSLLLRVLAVGLMLPVFTIMMEQAIVTNGLIKLKRALLFYGSFFILVISLDIILLSWDMYIRFPLDGNIVFLNSLKDLVSSGLWYFIYHQYYLTRNH